MSNEYYTESGYPTTSAPPSSAPMRAELIAIGDGFDKLPALAGNGGKIIAVNSGGTAQEAVTTTGTGSAVRATSPTLITPVLGTPSSGVTDNLTTTTTATAIVDTDFVDTNLAAGGKRKILWAATKTYLASTFAALAGSASQTFSVAAATAAGDALRADQGFLAQDFRLTLTSGAPVSGDVAAATTIYCCPYKGNRIALYNGAIWINYTSAEFSLALGTLTASKLYDVFCYQNAGVPTLEFLAWTNDTTRATALAYNSGILIKSGDATRRYLGTFYTISTTQTADTSDSGTVGRYLWNYYNRVVRGMSSQDSTSSWTYQTLAWRQARATATNQLNFIVGVVEDMISAALVASGAQATAGYDVSVGISCVSGGTASIVPSVTGASLCPINGYYISVSCATIVAPSLGRQNIAWLESGNATSLGTWYGISGNIKSTLSGSLMA